MKMKHSQQMKKICKNSHLLSNATRIKEQSRTCGNRENASHGSQSREEVLNWFQTKPPKSGSVVLLSDWPGS